MSVSAGNDEIITLKEIAGFLKVSEKTIFRMVQAGEIPGVKVSSQWRFVRSVIDDWLDSRMYGAPRNDLLHVINMAPGVMPIAQLIPDSRIVLDLAAGTRREVLGQLVRALARTTPVPDPEALIEELIEREEVVSTALGGGLRFPTSAIRRACRSRRRRSCWAFVVRERTSVLWMARRRSFSRCRVPVLKWFTCA